MPRGCLLNNVTRQQRQVQQIPQQPPASSAVAMASPAPPVTPQLRRVRASTAQSVGSTTSTASIVRPRKRYLVATALDKYGAYGNELGIGDLPYCNKDTQQFVDKATSIGFELVALLCDEVRQLHYYHQNVLLSLWPPPYTAVRVCGIAIALRRSVTNTPLKMPLKRRARGQRMAILSPSISASMASTFLAPSTSCATQTRPPANQLCLKSVQRIG